MRIEAVDERDSSWENHRPRFRVYLFGNEHSSTSWTASTYDIEAADVLDVIRWAQTEAGDDRLYAVALVGERRGERGITWLVGMDANDIEADDDERQLYDRMLARRGKRLVLDDGTT